ncbi:MAG: hypothetical protein ACYTGN_06110 [Planctomycetota bacterium]
MSRLPLFLCFAAACAAPVAGPAAWPAGPPPPQDRPLGGSLEDGPILDEMPPYDPNDPYPQGPEMRPVWGVWPHPAGILFGAAARGTLTYTTTGVSPSRDKASADAEYYRIAFEFGRTGLELNWFESASDLGAGTSAEGLDFFWHGHIPLYPNNRMRFVSKPGFYYMNYNLKNSLPSDVEPWSWGFRYELEGEVDIYKLPTGPIWTVYANGRFGFGWGEARIFDSRRSGRNRDWGWEAGTRFHFGQFFGALSWIDRTSDFEGSSFDSRYRFEGLNVSLGLRW